MSPFYRIYLIDDGSGSLGDTDQALLLEKGYLYLIPSFTRCDHSCRDFLSQYYVHFLEDNPTGLSLFTYSRRVLKIPSIPEDFLLFKRLLQLNPGRDLRRSDDPREYQNQPLLKGFQQQNNDISFAAYVETNGLILQLLSRFLTDEEFLSSQRGRLSPKIEKTVLYIQTHLSEPMTVELLAGEVNQSAHYFSKTFLQATGQRPLEYLMQRRIERAQYLMLTTSLSLSEIAEETGFESLSYFSRSFKKITGQSASQYSQANRF
ncbi:MULTISPECIES: helix-turn-helix domain-containing protein [unclassified Siphonobacter]|uniref:helix-turn-helix domain-containing protein n=1 Tax=unclassified Siphonobacter TaxID=2635712 RepID=UPI0012FF5421|nr:MULTISPECIES: AraC family transcriptional regulator [unclassified Siphonobacter]